MIKLPWACGGCVAPRRFLRPALRWWRFRRAGRGPGRPAGRE
ncbi:unnamed protein product [Tetraodon nigroviridis]|uniref:(spotted green pufferfish) hypothetical protein n=1 Tax=Tetraodon nigroviridis TaxID=99883 RepID=Q4SQN6_TETNG|nr:unnamed protein product [Tetraodon nigroviridis]